jgi:hypothetical protein
LSVGSIASSSSFASAMVSGTAVEAAAAAAAAAFSPSAAAGVVAFLEEEETGATLRRTEVLRSDMAGRWFVLADEVRLGLVWLYPGITITRAGYTLYRVPGYSQP